MEFSADSLGTTANRTQYKQLIDNCVLDMRTAGHFCVGRCLQMAQRSTDVGATYSCIEKLDKPMLGSVGATLLAWLGLFSWAVYKSVYNDHQDLAGRLRVVVNEKDNLKTGMTERDHTIIQLTQGEAHLKEQIQELRPLKNPRPSQPTTAEQPRSAGLSYTEELIPSTRNDADYAIRVVIQTKMSISPVHIAVICTVPLVAGMHKNGGAFHMYSVGVIGESRDAFMIQYESPALTPEQPIVVELFAKKPVHVVRLQTF
jgi:hypothetical protein